MTSRDKLIALLLAIGLIAIVIGSWIFPTRAEAYEGEGRTYTSETTQEEKENTSTSFDTDDARNVKNDAVDRVQDAVTKMRDAAEDILGANYYAEANNNYEDPEFVEAVNRNSQILTVKISGAAAKIFAGSSGLLVLHGFFAVLFTSYYEFFKSKKFSFFLPSVEATRSKLDGDGGKTSTTTTNPDGSITQSVTNIAKKTTGPFGTFIVYILESVVSIGVIMCIFLLIKNGAVMDAISMFIKAVSWGLGKIYNLIRGI